MDNLEEMDKFLEKYNLPKLNQEKNYKNTNIWMLNNMLLNNQQIMEEIKKEIKICSETNENENMTTQNLWNSLKSNAKRKVYSITSLPQETREKSNK